MAVWGVWVWGVCVSLFTHWQQKNLLFTMDGDIGTPELWFKSLPTLTRAILTLTFFSTLLATIGLFNPGHLLLDWTLIVNRFHLWRLITDYLFVGSFGFAWLMNVYFFVTFSSKLEVNEMFTVSPGAYLFFLLFQMVSLDVISLFMHWPTGRPMMAQGLVMSIIYYWSRREPYSQIGLWGFTVQAYQFPFVLLFLDLLLGRSLVIGLMGLTTGHMFYFLKDIMPMEKGVHMLRTPTICDELMLRFSRFDLSNIGGSLKVLVYGVSAAAAPSRPHYTPVPPPTGVFAGQGRRLGD
eukprot:Blabericola_migrator_1__1229@NODE_1315_length_4835_cov_207_490982_g885_i0_p3_GENE_NODE_1315_length_4835_cov_207_490982_g885_i0NODE_1315_length_4835_cov_207_490982_g885_i0_p3_ORF_typecomplete_len294_score45_29DER1/PF04511_15/5_1e46_NODE_1315_length_4835_cov_207_490982_g885_i036624543